MRMSHFLFSFEGNEWNVCLWVSGALNFLRERFQVEICFGPQHWAGPELGSVAIYSWATSMCVG